MSILGAHELGHYVLARRHGVSASLPYFIPLPLLGFGTLGAVIRVRDRIPTRNALVDIGAAGPLAGFLVALPFLAWGYAHSQFVPAPPTGDMLFGPMSLWSRGAPGLASPRAHRSTRTTSCSGPSSGCSSGRARRGWTSRPTPSSLAGWLGTLITMLNLFPIGQLDAGHLTHALFGDSARTLGRLALAGLAALTVAVSFTWLAWLLVVSLVVGVRHPPVVHPEEPLERRAWVGVRGDVRRGRALFPPGTFRRSPLPT